MRPRRPGFDFTSSLPHWNPSIEFSQMQNGGSLILPSLEPFLNKVMARARKELTGDDAKTQKLRADINIFIRQEANHYTLHGLYNERLHEKYDGLRAIEAEYAAELEEFLRAKPLKFLVAYCEGFEVIGPIYSEIWLDKIGDILEGSRGDVDRLWKWHWCEEYEHRSVVFDTYKALFGNAWLYRLKMMYFSLRHINSFNRRACRLMLRADRANMTAEERAASAARLKMLNKRMKRLLLPQLLAALSPFYDPKRRREPRGYRSFIASVDAISR